MKTSNVEDWPYYTLRELWDSYQEWSVYGAGVRFLLDSGDQILQYYVPYLSAIQLYGAANKESTRYRVYTGFHFKSVDMMLVV